MANWNAQHGIRFAKEALECANSNGLREKALKSIKIRKKILEHNTMNETPSDRGRVVGQPVSCAVPALIRSPDWSVSFRRANSLDSRPWSFAFLQLTKLSGVAGDTLLGFIRRPSGNLPLSSFPTRASAYLAHTTTEV
jgi:hypothetical protein